MALPLATQAACPPLLDSTHKRLLGPEESLCAYEGKVVLVVNTASHCGFTSQYEGLEAMYKTYRDKGLVVLGFPSDQFGDQEFAEDEKIANFCKQNFGVTFPLYSRSAVKGDQANALFRKLAEKTDDPPKWNFYKYLIHRDGKTVEVFSSMTGPTRDKLKDSVEKALAETAP